MAGCLRPFRGLALGLAPLDRLCTALRPSNGRNAAPTGMQSASGRAAAGARRPRRSGTYRRPIFSLTSAIVAVATGARRSAPASRMPSISVGWAMSSA